MSSLPSLRRKISLKLKCPILEQTCCREKSDETLRTHYAEHMQLYNFSIQRFHIRIACLVPVDN